MTDKRTVQIVALGLVALAALSLLSIAGLAKVGVAPPEVLGYTVTTCVGAVAALLASTRSGSTMPPPAPPETPQSDPATSPNPYEVELQWADPRQVFDR